MKKFRGSRGFTLIELIIVISLFSIIFTFLLVNISRPKVFADLESTEDLIYTTLKEAQDLSMTGGTGGSGAATSFGVHFEADKFILFQGATFNPGDSSNLETTLGSNLTIESITLPSGNVVFSPLSGEAQFTQEGFQLRETNTGEAKAFTINRLGAIDVN